MASLRSSVVSHWVGWVLFFKDFLLKYLAVGAGCPLMPVETSGGTELHVSHHSSGYSGLLHTKGKDFQQNEEESPSVSALSKPVRLTSHLLMSHWQRKPHRQAYISGWKKRSLPLGLDGRSNKVTLQRHLDRGGKICGHAATSPQAIKGATVVYVWGEGGQLCKLSLWGG